MKNEPDFLTGLCTLAGRYDALLCDVWGVLHNGRQAFTGVDDALRSYRAQGGKVLLLSNAPRPSATVATRLDKIGNRRDSYDAIVTSGDATRDLVSKRVDAGEAYYFVGPDKDRDLVAGLEGAMVAEAEADFVLLSGPRDDTRESPDDYADMLARFRARGLSLICANPDRMVQFGDRIIYCGGAIAERYEAMGGDVVWVGKPHAPIYASAQALLAEMGVGDMKRVLAIGDGAATDILGADMAGLDRLFMTGGLASGEAGGAPDTPEAVAEFLAKHKTRADYFMPYLAW